MKNLKIKITACLATVLFLGSCATENVEQTEEIQNQDTEQVGQIDGGYSYSEGYSEKFDYYHEGVKLNDAKKINEMLAKAINVFYEDNRIDISMSENEEKRFAMEHNFAIPAIVEPSDEENVSTNTDYNDLDNNEKLASKAEGNQKVYYNLFRSSNRLHGKGSKNYGSFRPQTLRFGNLNKSTKKVTIYRKEGNKPVTQRTYTIKSHKHVVVGYQSIAYAHAAY